MTETIDTIRITENTFCLRRSWRVVVTTTRGKQYRATWIDNEAPTHDEVRDAWRNGKRANWI